MGVVRGPTNYDRRRDRCGSSALQHRGDVWPQAGRGLCTAAVIGLTVLFGRCERVASSAMADQSLSEQAREAVLKSIIKSAPTVGNSPAGIRDLAEAYALLERELMPNAGVVQNKT
jgi:hypothetical protein